MLIGNFTNIEELWLSYYKVDTLESFKELLNEKIKYKYFQILKHEDSIHTFYGGNELQELYNDPDIANEKFLCEYGTLIKDGLFNKHISSIKSILWSKFKEEVSGLNEHSVTVVLNKSKKVLKTKADKLDAVYD